MDRASSSNVSLSPEELAEEAKLIHLEILKANKSLTESQETTNNLLKTAEVEVKFVDEKTDQQSCLVEEISKLKCLHTSEDGKRGMIAKQISLTRQMTQDISKVMEINNNIVQSLNKTIKNKEWDLSQQKVKQDYNHNLSRNFAESLDLKIVEASQTLDQEREVSERTLAEADRDLEALKQVLVSDEVDRATYKELVQESNGKRETIINDIKSKKQEIDFVTNNVSVKEAKIRELQMLNDKGQEEFDLKIERVGTGLEETLQSILKLERNTRTYADSDKHLTNSINELLEKVDIQDKVKSNLVEDVEKLSQSINCDTARWDKEKIHLQNNIDVESAEIEKLEIMLQEKEQKLQIINETNLKNTNVYEEKDKVMNDLQLKVKENELKLASLAEIFANLEQENLIDSNELESLTRQLKELEDQSLALERERGEEFARKNAQLNFLQAETEKAISMEQEKRKATIQAISAIKLEHDVKTFQQTKDFEQSSTLLRNDEESLEKEIKEMRSRRLTKENDLRLINQDCERVQEQVKTNEKMMKFLSNLAALKNKEPAGASAQRPSELVPPPTKKPFFDQLSGSSLYENGETTQDVKRLKEKEHRAKLRKIRKMQKMAESKK